MSKRIYETLDHEEVSIDEVIQKSGLPSSAVSVALLQFGNEQRLIRQLPGKNVSLGISDWGGAERETSSARAGAHEGTGRLRSRRREEAEA
jgi:hypothetical protein